MAGNNFNILFGLVFKRRHTVAYKAVGGAVRAVFTDAVFLVILIGQGIHISLRRHCLVERGVKYNHLRNFIAEGFNAGADCKHVRRIVKGC